MNRKSQTIKDLLHAEHAPARASISRKAFFNDVLESNWHDKVHADIHPFSLHIINHQMQIIKCTKAVYK